MEDLASQPLIDPVIPNKLYFRIGEVAKLAGIKPYVLRFWESEFNGLGPKKSGTGHRLYRRKDVEMVLEIKRLLYEKRFTIEGARKMLESKPKRSAAEPAAAKTAAGGTGTAASRRQQGELFSGGSPAFYQELHKELTDLLTLMQDSKCEARLSFPAFDCLRSRGRFSATQSHRARRAAPTTLACRPSSGQRNHQTDR